MHNQVGDMLYVSASIPSKRIPFIDTGVVAGRTRAEGHGAGTMQPHANPESNFVCIPHITPQSIF
jgi:hypothetical protein